MQNQKTGWVLKRSPGSMSARRQALRIWSLVLSSVLSIIGCIDWRRSPVQPAYGVVEYGMPHAEYRVIGTVRSSFDSVPIPGIRVILSQEQSLQADTSLTDPQGQYALGITAPCWDTLLQLSATDIDGAENGTYASSDSQVIVHQEDIQNGDGWLCGTAEKTIAIELKPLE